MNKRLILKKIKQFLCVALGVIILDIGFYFFMTPSKIIMGGMTGVSILLEPLYAKIGDWFTASIFLFIVNTITLIIGGILLGKDFFVKSVFSSLFSPLVVFIFEKTNLDPNLFLQYVSDSGYYFISLICGAGLSGLGLGIALKNNGSTGGMDVIQKIMSKYMKVPYSKTMYLTDWVIVFLSGFTFASGFNFNIEMVVYGVLGVLGVSMIIDAFLLKARNRKTVHIVTTKPEEIRDMLYREVDRGVTYLSAHGAYTGEQRTMVVCAMEKHEAYKIMDLIDPIDPEAFCYVTSTKEIIGKYDHKYDYDTD